MLSINGTPATMDDAGREKLNKAMNTDTYGGVVRVSFVPKQPVPEATHKRLHDLLRGNIPPSWARGLEGKFRVVGDPLTGPLHILYWHTEEPRPDEAHKRRRVEEEASSSPSSVL